MASASPAASLTDSASRSRKTWVSGRGRSRRWRPAASGPASERLASSSQRPSNSQNALQALGELLVVDGVLIQVLADVVAQGVLHLARLGPRGPLLLDVLLELGRGDLDGRDAGVDAQRDDVLVDQLADLLAHLLADQPLAAPVAVAGLGLDVRQGLGVVDEGQRLGPRQHQVQGRQELLELDVELGPQLLVLQELRRRLRCRRCPAMPREVNRSTTRRCWSRSLGISSFRLCSAPSTSSAL